MEKQSMGNYKVVWKEDGKLKVTKGRISFVDNFVQVIPEGAKPIFVNKENVVKLTPTG